MLERVSDSVLNRTTSADSAARKTNAAVCEMMQADMASFLRQQPDAAMERWAAQSEWTQDTGGARDGVGAPVRCMDGAWKRLFAAAKETVAAERERKRQIVSLFSEAGALREHFATCAGTKGVLDRPGVARVMDLMGAPISAGELTAAMRDMTTGTGSRDDHVEQAALEAWWFRESVPGAFKSEMERKLMQEWRASLAYKLTRRPQPTVAWRKQYLNSLYADAIGHDEALKVVEAANPDAINLFVPATPTHLVDASVRVALSTPSPASPGPHSPAEGVDLDVGSSTMPNRTPEAVKRTLLVARRRNPSMSPACVPLIAAEAAAAGKAPPSTANFDHVDNGNKNATSTTASAHVSTATGFQRLFHSIVVCGAGPGASSALQSATRGAKWWRPGSLRRFDQTATAAVGPAVVLSTVFGCDNASQQPHAQARTDQLRAFCFPEASPGAGSFGVTGHNGTKPLEPPVIDYAVFTMSEAAEEYQEDFAPRTLYGACVRTHEIILSESHAAAAAGSESEQGSSDSGRGGSGDGRCWTAPRVYCALAYAPCYSALFNALLSLIQRDRAQRTSNRGGSMQLAAQSEQVLATITTESLRNGGGSGNSDADVTRVCLSHAGMEFAVEVASANAVVGQKISAKLPSPWRHRAYEGVSDSSAVGAAMAQMASSTCLPPIGSKLRVNCGEGRVYSSARLTDTHELVRWALGDALEALGGTQGGVKVAVARLLELISALLLERRVVVACASPSIRTAVVTAALALIRSHWQWAHLALPLLPIVDSYHLELLGAPVPFILGVPPLQSLPPEARTEMLMSELNAPCVLCVQSGVGFGSGSGSSTSAAGESATWWAEGDTPPGLAGVGDGESEGGEPGSLGLAAELKPKCETLINARQQGDATMADEAMVAILAAVGRFHERLREHCLARWRRQRRESAEAAEAEAQIGPAQRAFWALVAEQHRKSGGVPPTSSPHKPLATSLPFVDQFMLSSSWDAAIVEHLAAAVRDVDSAAVPDDSGDEEGSDCDF